MKAKDEIASLRSQWQRGCEIATGTTCPRNGGCAQWRITEIATHSFGMFVEVYLLSKAIPLIFFYGVIE